MRVYKFKLQVNLNKPCSTKPTNDFNTAKNINRTSIAND